MKSLLEEVEDYVAIRQALGCILYRYEYMLKDFVSFLQRKKARHITSKLALEWAKQPLSAHPSWWAYRLSLIRGFAKYVSASDPLAEVPPRSLLPIAHRRTGPPHIFTEDEIRKLLKAARELKPSDGLRPWTYPTIFGLLWVTGMRVSEALKLDRPDVDFVRGILTIRDTKFGKSRLVPVHRSTISALRVYALHRDEILPMTKTQSFFVSSIGTRPTREVVNQVFLQLSRQIGLRGVSDRKGPRIHDLRHSFSLKTMVRLYNAYADPDPHVYKLSVYLGHVDPASTYRYLSAAPERLKPACQRLERKLGGQP